jgi:riboflavin transporter FmnP
MTSVRDPLGLLMNIAASGTFVVITGLLASAASTRLAQLRALAAATAAMTVLMVPVNYAVLSIAQYVPEGEVTTFICLAIVPFNLVKGVTNAVLVMLAWSRLKHGLGFR